MQPPIQLQVPRGKQDLLLVTQAPALDELTIVIQQAIALALRAIDSKSLNAHRRPVGAGVHLAILLVTFWP